MKFIIGLICNIVLLVIPLAARNSGDSLAIAMGAYLFQNKNYPAASTEYKRALFINPTAAHNAYLWVQLAQAYEHLAQFETATVYYKKAVALPISSPLAFKIRFWLALDYLRLQKFPLANLEFFKVERLTADKRFKINAQAFRVLILIQQRQWKQALQTFQRLHQIWDVPPTVQPLFQEIETLLQILVTQPYRKSPTTAKWLSTVLPGAGQMYAGDWRNGLNALLLNVGTTYLLWQSITIRSILDLTLIGSFVWWRYYEGNRFRAETIARNKNIMYQRKVERQLLERLSQLAPYLPAVQLHFTAEDFQGRNQ